MATQPNYLSHLSEQLATLMAQVLDDSASGGVLGLFRRPPSSAALSTRGFALDFLRHEIVEEHKGTLVETRDDDRVVVYRAPARIKATFRLSHPSLSGAARLQALDKLTSWFFDHRSLEPFFPEACVASPALREALTAQRADLRLVTPELVPSSGFHFVFEYAALYHSGTALREEVRVRTRTVNFSDPSERSLR